MLRIVYRNLNEFIHRIPVFFYFFTTVLSIITLMIAKHDYDARRYLDEASLHITVLPPKTKPTLSQESVDAAMEMFNIKVPHNVQSPTFDASLEDRGLTTLRGWGHKLEVSVGPAAFESWGLLGSTLAHELEVHCRQNFTLIRALDLIGFNGTWDAEREAYHHELDNAKRFHLTESERFNIKATLDFYYPLTSN